MLSRLYGSISFQILFTKFMRTDTGRKLWLFDGVENINSCSIEAIMIMKSLCAVQALILGFQDSYGASFIVTLKCPLNC